MSYFPWRQRLTCTRAMSNSASSWCGRLQRPRLEALEDRLAPATLTWTGAVSNLWSNPSNWSGGAPRVDTIEDLIFPAGASNLTNVNDIGAPGLLLQTITYTGSGYTTTGNGFAFVSQGANSAISMDPTVNGADIFNLNFVLDANGTTASVGNSGATLTLGGILSSIQPGGGSTFIKNGPGNLALTGNNIYLGQTSLLAGTLTFGSNTALGTSALFIAAGTIQADSNPHTLNNTLVLNGNFAVAGTSDLTLSGNTTLSPSSGLTSTVTATVANTGLTTFSGNIIDLSPSFTAGLNKAGPGTLVLSSNDTYAGPTAINAGTLLVNGTLSASAVTVGAGATLGGSGAVVKTITATGTVSPGGPGTAVLRALNGTTFNSGSTFAVKLNGTTVGSGYDQLNVGTAGLPVPLVIDLSASPKLNVMPGFAAASGNTFTIIMGTGAVVTGTFSGLPNNALANFNGQIFQINYTGSSVVLTRTTTATTTSLASSANPSVFGQLVNFMATVAAANASLGTPTGTVQFQIDGANLGNPVPLVGGVATTGTTTLAVGAHTVTTVYSGDSNFTASTVMLTQLVNQASTLATIVSSVNPSVFGQTVTFTLTLSARSPGAGTPTGTIQFQIDGSNAGNPVSLTTAGGVTTASLSTASLLVGTHGVGAIYTGDTNFVTTVFAPVAQTVNRADTTTTVVSSANPATFSLPVTFIAVVQPIPPGSGVPTGSVTFRDGNTILGTVGLLGTQNVSFTTNSLAGGQHSITAIYNQDANFNSSTSAPLLQTVVTTPFEAFVTALYRTVLERLPDAFGFIFWVQRLQAGASRAEIATSFVVSVEHRVLEVNEFYNTIFHRPADPAGSAFWVNILVSGRSEAEVAVGFLTSPEYTASHPANVSYLAGLYQDLLNHPGDPGGSAYWLDLLQRGDLSRGQLALAFLSSPEAYLQAIDFYYMNFLGRPADAAGRQGFLTALESAKFSPTQFSVIFLASDEFLAHAIMLAGG